MTASMRATPSDVWARGRGLALVALETGAMLSEGVSQALRDGVERTYAGDTPALPLEARAYRIEASGRDGVKGASSEAGVLAVRLGWPEPDAATVVAVAIDPARRGRSLGMRALVLAERALASEGFARTYAIVPRGNGHGMYFMLRCGYAPVLGAPPATLEASARTVLTEGVTWFSRVEGRRAAVGR